MLLITFQVLCIGLTVFCSNVTAKPQSGSESIPNQSLISATKKGDVNQVESLVKSGVNVNEKENESGLAPLHYSAGAGLEKITKLLIDGGAKVDIRNAEGKTPLEIAAVNGQVKIVEQLFEAGANIDKLGYSILKAIILAMPWFRRESPVNPFLNNTEVDIRDQEECCLFLISKGANVNEINDRYLTPLHLALRVGFDRIGESLINAGANINAVEKDTGVTPFHLAYYPPAHLMNGTWLVKKIGYCKFRCFDHSPVAELMIKKGADLNLPRSNDNYTPFHTVIIGEEDVNLINLMIKNGANINQPVKSGDTPLHFAIVHARVSVVKSLIEAGALINAKNAAMNTPLHHIGISETETEYFLRSDWVDFGNYIDDYCSIADLLIQNGADLNAKNSDGKTPLEVATNEKLRKLLKERMASAVALQK